MATITIEIDIDANGDVTLTPDPAVVADGDTVRWHVNSNARGGGGLVVALPPGADSPFGNTERRLQVGVEGPRRCNFLEPSTEPIRWPPGVNRYSYSVEFSGSPLISAVTGTLVKREAIRVEEIKFPEDVSAVFLVPQNPPIARRSKLKWFPKIHPLPWWKRWCWRGFYYHWKQCCCCCCCGAPVAPPPVVLPPPPAVVAPPTIVLSQGTLAIGGQFYILITPQGQRCQFVVQWTATGGVGQLTVDLDVRDPGATGFRRLASGLGPNDRFTFTGTRDTFLFRATVTDSRGQRSFNTLTVTCP